jgi:hypothetical protein
LLREVNTVHKGDSIFTGNNNNNNNNNNNIPVTIEATGIVTKSLRTDLEATSIQGKHSTDSLQQIAVLGTAHIIRKVLQCEA